MKLNTFRYWALAAVFGTGLTSCEDFLDRPAEDTYNVDNFYANDEQCIQGVNPLYNSPWFDFQRGFSASVRCFRAIIIGDHHLI